MNEVKTRKLPDSFSMCEGIPLAIKIGEWVLFYRDCNPSDPVPAVVVGRTPETLELLALAKDCPNLLPQPAVRHRSDPKLVRTEMHENGCWDWSTQHRDYARVIARLDELRRGLDELTKKK